MLKLHRDLHRNPKEDIASTSVRWALPSKNPNTSSLTLTLNPDHRASVHPAQGFCFAAVRPIFNSQGETLIGTRSEFPGKGPNCFMAN